MRIFGFFAIILSLSCAAPPPPSSLTFVNRWSQVSPETPEQAALRIWNYVHRAANPRCVEHIHNAEIQVLAPENLQLECRTEKPVAACMAAYSSEDGAKILLRNDAEGQSYEVLVHELLHVLLWCHGLGLAEANRHEDGVWRHIPSSNLPPESPWYVAPKPLLPLK